MRKIFTLLFFTLLTAGAMSQKVKQRLDSLVYFSQDSLKNIVRAAKNHYIYDSKGNCVLDQNSYLHNETGVWTSSSRTAYFYDQYNNDTTQINEGLNSTTNLWVQYNKYVTTYNSSRQRTSETLYDMDQNTKVWKRRNKREFVYDSQNRLISETYLDSIGALLKNASKSEWVYEPTQITKLQYNWSSEGAWNLTSQEISTLDNRGNATSVILSYKGFSGDFVYSSKKESVFSNDNDEIETWYFQWNDVTATWTPSSKYLFVYDEKHNQVSFENQAWIKNNNRYESQYKTEFTYDNDYSIDDMVIPRFYYGEKEVPEQFGHMLVQTYHVGFDGTQWVYFAPNKYYYSPQVITGINDRSTSLQLAYPNPMNDVLQVRGKAELYDVFGNRVMEGENRIEVSGLPSGVYFVKTDLGMEKVIKE